MVHAAADSVFFPSRFILQPEPSPNHIFLSPEVLNCSVLSISPYCQHVPPSEEYDPAGQATHKEAPVMTGMQGIGNGQKSIDAEQPKENKQ